MISLLHKPYLASQDSIKVMYVSEWIDKRWHWLYWCDSGFHRWWNCLIRSIWYDLIIRIQSSLSLKLSNFWISIESSICLEFVCVGQNRKWMILKEDVCRSDVCRQVQLMHQESLLEKGQLQTVCSSTQTQCVTHRFHLRVSMLFPLILKRSSFPIFEKQILLMTLLGMSLCPATNVSRSEDNHLNSLCLPSLLYLCFTLSLSLFTHLRLCKASLLWCSSSLRWVRGMPIGKISNPRMIGLDDETRDLACRLIPLLSLRWTCCLARVQRACQACGLISEPPQGGSVCKSLHLQPCLSWGWCWWGCWLYCVIRGKVSISCRVYRF